MRKPDLAADQFNGPDRRHRVIELIALKFSEKIEPISAEENATRDTVEQIFG